MDIIFKVLLDIKKLNSWILKDIIDNNLNNSWKILGIDLVLIDNL